MAAEGQCLEDCPMNIYYCCMPPTNVSDLVVVSGADDDVATAATAFAAGNNIYLCRFGCVVE